MTTVEVGIAEEFATVDAVLASDAETRGVDAFTLAVLKAERQMRRLFTYLVYQSEAFREEHIAALRDALAQRNDLYFVNFFDAWNKLYRKPVEELVGPDYKRLHKGLDNAYKYRNKIFHGQLTTDSLSREDLIKYVADIRCWCRALAAGAQQEVGYDGFGRDSFQKSKNSDLAGRLSVPMNSVEDYKSFLEDVSPKKKSKNKKNKEKSSAP